MTPGPFGSGRVGAGVESIRRASFFPYWALNRALPARQSLHSAAIKTGGLWVGTDHLGSITSGKGTSDKTYTTAQGLPSGFHSLSVSRRE